MDSLYWRRLKGGDPEALGYLYDTYVDKLFQSALYITSDRELAKDAIQEVFVELWTYRKNIDEIIYSQGYLTKTLRNILFKKVKKEQLANREIPAEHMASAELNREDTLISVDLEHEQKRKLQRALASLTHRQQQVVELRFYNGLSYKQIAGMLGMNYQSVNNLAFRAMLNLRRYMLLAIIIGADMLI